MERHPSRQELDLALEQSGTTGWQGEILSHAQDCPACRKAGEALLRTQNRLRHLPRERMQPFFRMQLRLAVQKYIHERKVWRRLCWSAAAGILAGIGLVLLDGGLAIQNAVRRVSLPEPGELTGQIPAFLDAPAENIWVWIVSGMNGGQMIAEQTGAVLSFGIIIIAVSATVWMAGMLAGASTTGETHAA